MPLTIYPNPVSSAARLTVQVLNRPATAPSADVYLLDAFGRPVLTTSLDVTRGQASFDLTGLAAGVYVVRYGGAARKVLIQQ